MVKQTAKERKLWEAIRELELRLSVLEQLPTPIVFAVGRMFPDPVRADMQAPVSNLEH